MEKMTITEALSEINLTNKKLEKKRATVCANLTRYKHVPDPFVNDGGTAVALQREMQSISDLEKRVVRIRSAIAKANLTTDVTVGEETKTVYEWLTWRKDVVEGANDKPGKMSFLQSIISGLKG